jgi:hypothetical protein
MMTKQSPKRFIQSSLPRSSDGGGISHSRLTPRSHTDQTQA